MADIAEYLSRQLLNLGVATGNEDLPSLGSRYIGGHSRKNQPFISGYHQILFPTLPEGLFPNASVATNINWLTSTCEGFTPHSSNINFIDVQGIGQLGSSFPASRTINREFTLTFREYQSLPILNIFRTWNALFDPHLGITTFNGIKDDKQNFIPVNYKGSCIVALLKPTATNTVGDRNRALDVTDIEEIYMYEGVFPTGVPEDTITAADQATNDSVQASVTFKFDGAPIDKSDTDLAKYFIETIDIKYGNVLNNVGVEMK